MTQTSKRKRHVRRRLRATAEAHLALHGWYVALSASAPYYQLMDGTRRVYVDPFGYAVLIGLAGRPNDDAGDGEWSEIPAKTFWKLAARLHQAKLIGTGRLW